MGFAVNATTAKSLERLGAPTVLCLAVIYLLFVTLRSIESKVDAHVEEQRTVIRLLAWVCDGVQETAEGKAACAAIASRGDR
jgi:hypothetical protein